jgi:hypothetical protein
VFSSQSPKPNHLPIHVGSHKLLLCLSVSGSCVHVTDEQLFPGLSNQLPKILIAGTKKKETLFKKNDEQRAPNLYGFPVTSCRI